MYAARHAAFQTWKSLNESVRPAQTSSTFEKDKRLTPQEFEAAGEFLVHAYPTWSWESGSASKAKSYLPADKQFLITRNVTGAAEQAEAIVAGEGGDEEDWVAPERTGGAAPSADGNQDDGIPTLGEDAAGRADGDDDEDSVPDIDDLDIGDEEADEAALPSGSMRSATEPDNIRRTRTYDIMITYDKYHAVPMIWLQGYDEDRRPLKPDRVMEDISSDYAKKTATLDPFPHASISAVGIHPCKHAETMKRLSDAYSSGGGKKLLVDHYMVLFLKFIASVIPTIEYDYTSSAGGF